MLNLITATGQGQLLETMVANQLQHYGQVSYYNKRNTAEIDFILNNEIAFEVKQKAVIQDLHKLEKLAGNLRIPQLYIVSNTITSNLNRVVYPWFF